MTQSEAMKLFEEKVTDENDIKSMCNLAKNVRKECLVKIGSFLRIACLSFFQLSWNVLSLGQV